MNFLPFLFRTPGFEPRHALRQPARRLNPLAVAALAVGCSVYDPGLIPSNGGRPDLVDAGAACPLLRPPARPEVEDGPDTELVFALRDIVLDQGGERWREIGFDLDGQCSLPVDEPEVECVPPNPEAEEEVDGEFGVDNAFGHQFYPIIAATIPMLQADARESGRLGRSPILLRIRGYNGEPNDPRVAVTFATAVGMTPAEGAESPPAVRFEDGVVVAEDDGAPLPPPNWDGDDWYWARIDAFLMGDAERPLVRDDNAYVANGTLVFRLPDRTPVLFQGREQSAFITISGGVASAQLNLEEPMRLDPVVVAGRWPSNDIIQTAEMVGLCPGSAEFTIAETQLTRVLDLREVAGSGGPGVACDAMSVGLRFTGYPVRFAGLLPGPTPANACD